MKIIFAATILFATFARADVTSISILPSATDPAIKTFDSPHAIYINRDIVVDQSRNLPQDRHQLLLWITGTGGKAQGAAVGFCNLAANLGCHVVSIMYPDDIPASACANDSNPNSFENFRMAIIRGGHAVYQNGRKEIFIERPESIENRLIKLLLRLKAIRPKEHWEPFLNDDGTIKWESIAVAGQSQGGGHAALIGIKHRVARVLCFGSPKDFNKKLNAPAAYYSVESATPKNRFFSFNHLQDSVGCTQEQLQRNLKALELNAFGSPVDAATENPPYNHTRILTTSYPVVTETSEKQTADGKNSQWESTAHTSVIATRNAERWQQVWTYLLTETTP